MSLGAITLPITINSVVKTLKRIKQDDFWTQYYLHEALEEWTVNVRHSIDSPNKFGVVYDRHNVELIHTVFATVSAPARTRNTYVTTRNERSDDYTLTGYDIIGVADLIKVAGNVPDLLGWVG
jgi:hypothetical protein